MAKYSDPKFIGKIQPDEIPLEPVAPQKTSGLEMAGTVAGGLTDAIQNYYKQKIADAESKAKQDLMAAQAEKAMASSDLEGRKLDLEEKKQNTLDSLFNEETPTTASAKPAGLPPSPPASPDPAAVDKMVSDRIPDEKPQKEIDAELKKFRKARLMGLIDEAAYKRKEKELVIGPQIEKFSDLYDNYAKINGKPPTTQEDLTELASQASPDGKLFEEEFFKTRMKTLPSKMDLDKQRFEKKKQEFAETKEETAGREKLGDNLKDYRAVIPVYNKVADEISKPAVQKRVGDAMGYFKSMSRSLGFTDIPGGWASLINMGAEKTGLGTLRSSPDPRDREQLQILEHINSLSPEERKKIIPPDVARIFANISTLINKTLKKEAGSAVSGQEAERMLNQFGLNIYGDPQNFFESLAEMGSNLSDELQYVKEGANQKVVEKLTRKGLFDIRIPTITRQNYTAPKKKNIGDQNEEPAPASAPVASPKEGDTMVNDDGDKLIFKDGGWTLQ